MLCFYCHTQEKLGNIDDQGNKEKAYISKGFSYWKNATESFRAHQKSACHIAASAYHVVTPKCADVGELLDNQLNDKRKIERKYLLDVIRCLRYLGRQGIALQGHNGNDNFTQLLLLFGSKDNNITDHINGKIGHKYNHHDVQNELLNLMGSEVLRKRLDVVRDRRFFSMIADEGTDVSNSEQLSFCVRSVDEALNVNEDFLGFYEIDNIKSETIVNAIRDILIRCSLTLSDCRGQTYDGASNMMGKRSGVATVFVKEQPKALQIHCLGHSLSLSVKSLTAECSILRDTMGTAGEICVLVKYSPKREKLLGKINENIEGDSDDLNKQASKLDKLSATRWTVRANCFKKIIENYDPLMDLWKQSLKDKPDAETKARIIGCKKQMESFNFFFGLNLGHKLYNHTDKLSQTLQKEKLSAIDGKEIAEDTVKTLMEMRNDSDFDLFFELVTKSANTIKFISAPTAPRKRKRPKYDILQYLEGYERESEKSEPYYPETPQAYYKQIFFEALDVLASSIKERFAQPAFKILSDVEQLILKSIKKQPVDEEIKLVNEKFAGDFNKDSLPSELEMLPVLFKGEDTINFNDIVRVVKSLSLGRRRMIENVVIIIRLVLTMGATSATPERSFSSMRRLKTWLRSTMKQKRFNSLAIMSEHKETLDSLSLIDIANEFVRVQPERLNIFGKFTENDL